MGGDSPGVETSWVAFVFADDDERPCPHCGGNREVFDQPRVQYDPLSGHDPMGLLGVPAFSADKQTEIRSTPLDDPERVALEEQLRVQAEAIAKLEERLNQESA